jgi:predicted nucleotide-binding protein
MAQRFSTVAVLHSAILEAVYHDAKEQVDEFAAATDTPLEAIGENLQLHKAAVAAGLDKLGLFRELIDLDDFRPSAVSPPPDRSAVSEASESKDVAKTARGGGIFLVHGRDEAVKETVARFLDRVTESGVTILHEQADRGRTIIEKFEEHAAAAGYAVVLLTGDDEGRMRGEGELRPRARQNVILELGFFVGTLGRGQVALLYGEGVELPSDIQGVLFLPLDAGGVWKTKLAGEMLDAGVSVDPTKVLRA